MTATEDRVLVPEPRSRHSTRRWLVGGVAVVVLGLGALVAAPAIASAKSDPTADTQSPKTVADCQDRAANGEFPRMTEFLAGLVSDGIVSQDQSDQIDARFRDRAEYACLEHLLFPKREAITVTADTTSTSVRQVRAVLVGGGTLAGYAAVNGLDELTLTSDLMAAPNQRAADLVAGGQLSQDEANDILADVQTYIGRLIHAEGIRGFRQTRW
jgi:hypothetical protein